MSKQTTSASSLKPTKMSGAAWWKDKTLAFLVLSFASPRTAFDSRLVCRSWNDIVDKAPSDFWRHIVMALIPWCKITILLLAEATPQYLELRHFSKMSLGNTQSLQHVIICDIAHTPLLWLTNVPISCRAQDLYTAAEVATLGMINPVALSLIASGVILERTKTLAEHLWPVRRGKRGWRLDLIIIIRGFDVSQPQPVNDPSPSVLEGGENALETKSEEESNAVLETVKSRRELPKRVMPVDFSSFLKDHCAL